MKRLFSGLLGWVGVWILAVQLAPAADLPAFRMDVQLRDAVVKGARGEAGSNPLLLHLMRIDDRWERVYGIAGSFNIATHTGFVTDSAVSDAEVKLTVEMNVYGDPWVPGGRAKYNILLRKKAGHFFEGSYEGTFRGLPVKGAADGTRLPPAVRISDANAPIQPGEHPRILFRKSELPVLREKAKTEFGKAVLAKMTDGIGLGVQYQLTGDKSLAEKSQAYVEKLLNGDNGAIYYPYDHHGMSFWGPAWEQVAVAYDLCYDAWTDEFRKRCERYLVLWGNRILYQRPMFNAQGQYDFGNSDEGAWLYYGVALGGLALWGEKGPEPVKPAPFDRVSEVAPATDYKAGKDVPVIPLEPGKSPNQWIYTKPVNHWMDADPLKDLGGYARCRPESGSSFQFEGKTYTFEPVPADFIPKDGGIILNIGKSIRPGHVKSLPGPEMIQEGPLTLCLFTVLDNPEPRVVKVNAGGTRWGYQQFVLNGQNLAHGQVVKLGKGLYPLLVVMRIAARWDHMTPKLDPATDADLAGNANFFARVKTESDDAVRDWEWDAAEWKRTGGFNQEYQKSFELLRWEQYMHFREGFGTGAAQSDTAGHCQTLGLLPAVYAGAYRRCFGWDVSPYADMTHFLTRRVWAWVYSQDGKAVTQTINGPNDAQLDYFPLHYPIVPDAWKPVILWAWHRQAGITGPNDAGKSIPAVISAIPTHLFVNYPLDPKTGRNTVEPRPPQGILPFVWEAPDYGYYATRNGWNGAEDFLFQAYARSKDAHGYNMPNAGTFALMGLGHAWCVPLPSLRLNNQRTFSNVVLLPDDDISAGARGFVTHARFDADGSGVLTVDLNDVYAAPVKNPAGKGTLRQYDKYGTTRFAEGFDNSKLKGLRSFAVDYSGKSGAPCLLVLVDQIAGGNQKVWTWHIPADEVDERTQAVTRKGDLDKIRVEGSSGVTLTHPDGANLRMTFVAPAQANVKAEKRAITYTRTYNRGEGAMSAPGIFASGADPKDGNFFVVVTVQKGPAPEVKVQGEGLGAKVTIGKRVVSFDGVRIVMGE